jgi:hypothetical protein
MQIIKLSQMPLECETVQCLKCKHPGRSVLCIKSAMANWKEEMCLDLSQDAWRCRAVTGSNYDDVLP